MTTQTPVHETAPTDEGARSATSADILNAKLSRTFEGIIKPRLRGWIHAGTAPLALAGMLCLLLPKPHRSV